jgi:hypothetical protein
MSYLGRQRALDFIAQGLEPGKLVKIGRWGNVAEARWIISESIERILVRRLDEAAHLRATIRLDKIQPIAEQFRIGDIARRRRSISVHGALFTPSANSNYFRHGTLSVVEARGAA